MTFSRYARALVGLFVLTGAALAPVTPVGAQALNFSSNARQVKVGVLIPSQWRRPSLAPNLFFALEKRTDLKPSGWEFINPKAPQRVDSPIAVRWNVNGAYTGNPTAQNPYPIGMPLEKMMAAYWEVPLGSSSTEGVSAEDLSQYDILYLAPPQQSIGVDYPRLTWQERDKLRKAVDAGVLLWIEHPATDTRVTEYNLFAGWDFTKGNSGIGSVAVRQALSPLLNQPYNITQAELNSLFGGVPQRPLARMLPTYNNSEGIEAAHTNLLPPLITDQNNQNTVVVAGSYGSGYVVMSSAVGPLINNSVGVGLQQYPWAANNMGAYSGYAFGNIPISALKFAYNLLSATQDSPQERLNPRRTASTSEVVGAPLIRKWSLPDARPNAQDPIIPAQWNNADFRNGSAAPAVYKGVVFVPAANGWLYALDLDPTRDLDQDGNPDDGWNDSANRPAVHGNDLSAGASYDVLWAYDFNDKVSGANKQLSTPTLATLTDPKTGIPVDVLYISTSDGKVYALYAFPQKNGRISGDAQLLWPDGVPTGGPNGGPYAIPNGSAFQIKVPAPVFGDGRLFVAGNAGQEGVVEELNPLIGERLWFYQGTTRPKVALAPQLGPIIATPALAWVSDPNTDARDLVLYVPTLASVVTSQTTRISAFLLSVRGERLSNMGDPQRFRSRYWVQPNNFRWQRSYVRSSLNRANRGTPNANQPGTVDMALPANNADELVLADYDLDPTDQMFKPRSVFYGFPGSGQQYPGFISSPVVGPDDTLYAVATDPIRNLSCIYAFRDASPVAYVKWRYTLQGAVVNGPPAYYNGALYVGTTTGRLIGFDANPNFYIDITGALDTTKTFQIQLVQQDPSLPANAQSVTFQYNQAMMDAGNISEVDPITKQQRLHLRINLKRFSLTGSVALDAALPVQVKFPVVNQATQGEETGEMRSSTSLCGEPGQQKTLFTNATGNQANKLFDLPLSEGQPIQPSLESGPALAGDSLYITGGDGNVYFMTADPCALTGAGRSGIASADARPQEATVPFTATLQKLIFQNSLPIRGPVVISNGHMVANTPSGVMAFYQPITVVADANRILETRTTYEPKQPNQTRQPSASVVAWQLSSTSRYNAFAPPGVGSSPAFASALPQPETRNLSHPGSVRRLSSTNFLIADTGNNRIVEVDRAGTVLWEATNFADPYNILQGSEPLTFNTPTDAQRWNVNRSDGAVEIHTLIVDNGNHRVVELRDTYTRGPRGGTPEYHVLVWSSRTNLADNRYYEYRAAQRVPGDLPGLPPGDYTIATVSNARVNSVTGSLPDTPGGSLVVLNGPRKDANGVLLRRPDGSLVDPGGVVVAFARDFALTANAGATLQPIVNPTSFERIYTGSGTQEWQGLLTDGNGAYKVTGAVDPNTKELKLVMRSGVVGRVFDPASDAYLPGPAGPQAIGLVMAKQLANGNILLVNQALNQIYEYDSSINKMLPLTPTAGTQSLSQPSSADRSF